MYKVHVHANVHLHVHVVDTCRCTRICKVHVDVYVSPLSPTFRIYPLLFATFLLFRTFFNFHHLPIFFTTFSYFSQLLPSFYSFPHLEVLNISKWSNIIFSLRVGNPLKRAGQGGPIGRRVKKFSLYVKRRCLLSTKR